MSPDIPKYAADMSDMINHFISETTEKLSKLQAKMFLARQEDIYRHHMLPRMPSALKGKNADHARTKRWLQDNNYHYDIGECQAPGWMCRRIRQGTTTIAVHFYRITLS